MDRCAHQRKKFRLSLVLLMGFTVVWAGGLHPSGAGEQGTTEKATSNRAATTTGCDQAPHYLWKGRMARNADVALEHYRKAIELCPGYIRPYELAGNLHRKQGRSEKAIACFEKAAELGTANHKLYHLLASLLFDRGDLDQAGRRVNQALRLHPGYAPSLELKTAIEATADREGPKLLLFEPSTRRGLSLIHGRGNLTVRGLAFDRSGVARVEVNGARTEVNEQGHFLRDVPIGLGENAVVVEAVDVPGNLSRLSVSVRGEACDLSERVPTDVPVRRDELYGMSRGLVIGIDRYERWPSLEFAAADARAVKQALLQSGFDEVVLILNEDATQRRILTELYENLPKRSGPNDRVLFYFAGHGQTEVLPDGGRRGYILPVDAGRTDYPSTAVSMDQIRSLSRRIPAKHILYVMDSCYSGLGLNRSAGLSPDIGDYLRKMSSMRAVQIVTAGGKGEQVQERAGHGLFTTFFLQALDGQADLNGDRVVTGTELGAYIRPVVSNASRQAQTPLYGRLEGEGEFLFFVSKPEQGS